VTGDRRRDSVGLPVTGSAHVRVGRAGPPDCQIPLKRIRLTADFLHLEKKEIGIKEFGEVGS
tara:strand:+ start:103 stop:288 length:186 start_codon:yes stop_codon:yes gene_type:complete